MPPARLPLGTNVAGTRTHEPAAHPQRRAGAGDPLGSGRVVRLLRLGLQRKSRRGLEGSSRPHPQASAGSVMTWPHAFSFERRVPLRHFASDPAHVVGPSSSERPKPKARGSRPVIAGAGRAKLIIAEVATKHGLSVAEIMGGQPGSARRRFSWPRQEAMVRLRDETLLSTPQIARALGLKDHSTVLAGFKAHAKRAGEGA